MRQFQMFNDAFTIPDFLWGFGREGGRRAALLVFTFLILLLLQQILLRDD
jgi:hypothetical protein